MRALLPPSPQQPYGTLAVIERLYDKLWDLMRRANEPARSPLAGQA
ncbi:MAG TPA: hypothetical protein VEZ41_02575 [Allosphingosinicella sp.]|nr:hypothetical protein [Allosphingosinicella sp.]